LKSMMQTKGRFNNKILKRGEFTTKYFDTQNNFLSKEMDPVTKQFYYKPIHIGEKPTRDLASLLSQVPLGTQPEEQKYFAHFRDFLEKCLALDPKNRITPEEALAHPFLSSQTSKNSLQEVRSLKF